MQLSFSHGRPGERVHEVAIGKGRHVGMGRAVGTLMSPACAMHSSKTTEGEVGG